MSKTAFDTALDERIRDVFRVAVQDGQERFIQQAVADYEKELRNTIGRIGIDLARYFTFERSGQTITIAIRDLREVPNA